MAGTDELLAYIERVALPEVRKNGWHVHGHTIDPGRQDGNITYTVGLTEAGLPELALAGLPHDIAAVILNDCARKHLTEALRPGRSYNSAGGAYLDVVDAPGIPGPLARAMYGGRVRFLQLLWDVLADPVVYDQPLPAELLPAGDGVVGHRDEVGLRNEHRRMGEK